jgi:hypothetical protein
MIAMDGSDVLLVELKAWPPHQRAIAKDPKIGLSTHHILFAKLTISCSDIIAKFGKSYSWFPSRMVVLSKGEAKYQESCFAHQRVFLCEGEPVRGVRKCD